MISICTAIIGGMDKYLEIFLDSVARNCQLVKEINIAKTDEQSSLNKHWTMNGIKINLFAAPVEYPKTLKMSKDGSKIPSLRWLNDDCGHAWGLHAALERCTEQYIWFSDPDVFFYTAIDRLYIDLLNKHSLSIIGISHHNPEAQCYRYFPCVTNCLVKHKTLPDENWLGGDFFAPGSMLNGKNYSVFPMKGKWMMPGPLPDYAEEFPNPNGLFDCACNLWLWNEQRKGRWLAFGLPYSTNMQMSNFNHADNLGAQQLLTHRIRGARNEDIAPYVEFYERLVGANSSLQPSNPTSSVCLSKY